MRQASKALVALVLVAMTLTGCAQGKSQPQQSHPSGPITIDGVLAATDQKISTDGVAVEYTLFGGDKQTEVYNPKTTTFASTAIFGGELKEASAKKWGSLGVGASDALATSNLDRVLKAKVGDSNVDSSSLLSIIDVPGVTPAPDVSLGPAGEQVAKPLTIVDSHSEKNGVIQWNRVFTWDSPKRPTTTVKLTINPSWIITSAAITNSWSSDFATLSRNNPALAGQLSLVQNSLSVFVGCMWLGYSDFTPCLRHIDYSYDHATINRLMTVAINEDQRDMSPSDKTNVNTVLAALRNTLNLLSHQGGSLTGTDRFDRHVKLSYDAGSKKFTGQIKGEAPPTQVSDLLAGLPDAFFGGNDGATFVSYYFNTYTNPKPGVYVFYNDKNFKGDRRTFVLVQDPSQPNDKTKLVLGSFSSFEPWSGSTRTNTLNLSYGSGE